MKSAKCLESLISFKCSKCPLCCNVRIIIDLKQCKKRYYCASPSCVHSTESTQHLHCRAFRVMVLLFFTQRREIHKKMRSWNFLGSRFTKSVVLGESPKEK